MVSTPLVVIGAGGFGREAVEAALAANDVSPTWDLLGFADDDASLHGTRVDDVEVLGPVDGVLSRYPSAHFTVTTGRPDNYFSRPRIARRLAVDPGRWATIVHPAASVARSATVGYGTVILAGVVVTAAARIGNHVAVMPGTVITHDDVVGDFATLAAGVRLGGGVEVGEGAYLGAGAMVRQGLTVGRWSLVGMGAVVTRAVPEAEQWVGTPARRYAAVEPPHDLLGAGPTA